MPTFLLLLSFFCSFILPPKESPEAWLIKSLETYFAKYDKIPLTKLCTPTYIAYKQDALEIDYDSGLSLAAFKQKWKGKFDTKYAGVNQGFFISGQDFGKIRVTTCTFLRNDENGKWYKVVLRDDEFKVNYRREIRLIEQKGSYKIADVKEFNDL